MIFQTVAVQRDACVCVCLCVLMRQGVCPPHTRAHTYIDTLRNMLASFVFSDRTEKLQFTTSVWRTGVCVCVCDSWLREAHASLYAG